MRTVAYELRGKEVPSHLQGAIINIKIAETVADGITNKLYEDESALVEKANDGRVIAIQGLLRGKSGKEGATVESLQAFADGYCYSQRKEGTGTPRQRTAKTEVTEAAASVGNRMMDRALADAEYAKKAIRLGAFSEEELAAYGEKKAKAEAEAAAKAAAKQAPKQG